MRDTAHNPWFDEMFTNATELVKRNTVGLCYMAQMPSFSWKQILEIHSVSPYRIAGFLGYPLRALHKLAFQSGNSPRPKVFCLYWSTLEYSSVKRPQGGFFNGRLRVLMILEYQLHWNFGNHHRWLQASKTRRWNTHIEYEIYDDENDQKAQLVQLHSCHLFYYLKTVMPTCYLRQRLSVILSQERENLVTLMQQPLKLFGQQTVLKTIQCT